MILYFTGTGNSLYVAKKLDKEIYSIPQEMNSENPVYHADSIGIVCPVYGHEMPLMVREFIRKATFETDYFYLILTFGRIHGGAAELAKVYLNEAEKEAQYINAIMMTDNFPPGFDMEEQISILFHDGTLGGEDFSSH